MGRKNELIDRGVVQREVNSRPSDVSRDKFDGVCDKSDRRKADRVVVTTRPKKEAGASRHGHCVRHGVHSIENRLSVSGR